MYGNRIHEVKPQNRFSDGDIIYAVSYYMISEDRIVNKRYFFRIILKYYRNNFVEIKNVRNI